MKILTFILSFTVAAPSWASLGSGLPDNFCAYNASSVRAYEPQSVIDARTRLEAAQNEKKDLEKKLSKIDCDACADNFETVISIVANGQLKAYEDHMAGGNACVPVGGVASNVTVYNYWAEINGWDQIEESGADKFTPDRMIAGSNDGGSEVVGGAPAITPPTITPPPAGAPEFSPTCPYYAGPNGSVKVDVCERAGANISRDDRRLCNRCLRKTSRYSSGRYAFCLRSESLIQDLEDKIADLEADLEDAIDEAADSGEEAVCADCMRDNRNFLQKYGPSLLVGGLTLFAANSARRSERQSYEYYRDVIHPDNNAKGYPTPMMADRSGATFATVLVAGVPTVINTAMASGAFGCSGSSLFGGGMVSGGQGAGAQVGGASGIFSGLFGGGNGGGAGGQWGGTGMGGPWGGNGGATTGSGYIIGPNGQPIYGAGGQWGNAADGGGGMSLAQLQAQAAQSQQAADAAAQRASALSSYVSNRSAWEQSQQAIFQNTQAQLNAIGQAPTMPQGMGGGGGAYGQYGVNGQWGGGGNMSGVMNPNASIFGNGRIQGGVFMNVNAGAGAYPPMMGAQAGYQYGGYQQGGAGFNPNVAPPSVSSPSGGGSGIGNM